MTSPHSARSIPVEPGLGERLKLVAFYVLSYLSIRPVLGPPLPAVWQRRLLALAGVAIPNAPGTRWQAVSLGGVPAEEVRPDTPREGADGAEGAVMLYLHGGAFLVGGPASHRPLTTLLAQDTGARILAVDYRLEPEHAFPAALEDCLAAYRALLAEGVAPARVVVAGDSAGGALAVMLALRLKRLGLPQPAGLILISPVTGMPLDSPSHERFAVSDPLLRPRCLAAAKQIMAKAEHPEERVPAQADLTGLPPMLIQVGTIEALLDDSLALAAQAERCGVAVRLEVQEGQWHVSQLFAPYLRSARASVQRIAQAFRDMTAGRTPFA